MTEAELKMVADHMGHSLNVHTDIYRLQSCLLEKTKVARVLIAMENGNIDSFQGKSLQSIEVESMKVYSFYCVYVSDFYLSFFYTYLTYF
jgi:hypothetical protein